MKPAEHYASVFDKYTLKRMHIIESLVPTPGKNSKKRAIDIGCGEGWFTRMLGDKGYDCLGVDIDDARIRAATERFGGNGIAFQMQDAMQLNFPIGSYDLVLCLELIEHLDNPVSLLRGIQRLVKPDGLLIISTPNNCSPEGMAGRTLEKLGGRNWNAWDPTHKRIFTSWELVRLLRENNLDPIRIVGYCYFPSVYRFTSARFMNKIQGLFDPVRYSRSSRRVLRMLGFNIVCVCRPT